MLYLILELLSWQTSNKMDCERSEAIHINKAGFLYEVRLSFFHSLFSYIFINNTQNRAKIGWAKKIQVIQKLIQII